MMDRRTFAIAAALAVCTALSARSQPRSKHRRVGLLAPGTVPDPTRYPEPLISGLRDLGWIEGGNITIERRIAADRTDRLPAMAEELVALNVDVIVTIGTPAALAARKATSTIPIVMATIGDPVGMGLTASLARPSGNLTGNTFIEPDLGAKRLQLLKELLPNATLIGQFINPTNPAMQAFGGSELVAMRELGLQPVLIDVMEAKDFEPAFVELVRQRVDALVVHSDSLMISNRAQIMQSALKHALPTMAEGRTFVEAGAVFSYAPSSAAMIRNAAKFIHNILNGAKPADLPIERPTRFEFVVNVKTAKALGLTIPPSILLRADEVIE